MKPARGQDTAEAPPRGPAKQDALAAAAERGTAPGIPAFRPAAGGSAGSRSRRRCRSPRVALVLYLAAALVSIAALSNLQYGGSNWSWSQGMQRRPAHSAATTAPGVAYEAALAELNASLRGSRPGAHRSTLWLDKCHVGQEAVNKAQVQQVHRAVAAGLLRPRQEPWKQCRTAAGLPQLREVARLGSAKPWPQAVLSIATQLSLERLPMLETQCRLWPGPTTAAIYLPLVRGRVASADNRTLNGTRLDAALLQVMRLHAAMEAEPSACQLDVQVLLEERCDREQAVLFPANAMRNLALALARTEAVALLDADFCLSAALGQRMRSAAYSAALLSILRQGAAVVLPAFEAANATDPGATALVRHAAVQGKAFVVEQLAAHRLSPFQKRFHKATDFRAWVRSDKIYNISFQPLFEPYLIMRRAYVPWADESLRGYYFNKQLLMRHVAALGAHLVVHPAAFVLHQPHKSSAMRWKTRHLGGLRACKVAARRGGNYRHHKVPGMAVEAAEPPLSQFFLYQTSQRLFLVGTSKGKDAAWRLLKFHRDAEPGGALQCTEDPTPYTRQQMTAVLRQLHSGNLQHGGLQLVCQACGVLGCFRFVEGHYLLLVTKKAHLATVAGHKVYGVEATAMVPLLSAAAYREGFRSGRDTAAAEQRYRRLFALVQLNSQFFFSYSLPIWQTLQAAWTSGGGARPFASDRVWNEWLSRSLRGALGPAAAAAWVLPLAHGCLEQRRLSLVGRALTLTLVARRSREFAGTRYRRRGVDAAGHTANDVEVEQILEAGRDWHSGEPLLSAVVQVRGSIPLFWTQSADSASVKPKICLQHFDPLFAATRAHFEGLRARYGSPLVALNLVKQEERRPRESLLGQEYAAAVAHINRGLPSAQRVQYVPWDLSARAKRDQRHLLEDLTLLQAPLLRQMGLFATGGGGAPGGRRHSRDGAESGAPPAPRLQHGVLRTNCIDSLDRTNIAQFTFGLLALGHQLHTLGIAGSPRLDPDSSLARQLMDMYERAGHTLAQQYTSSEAHTTFFQRQRGDSEAATQSRDFLTSLRRFYSASFTDADKQAALDIFLGHFGRRLSPTSSPLPPSQAAPPARSPPASPPPGGGAAAPSPAGLLPLESLPRPPPLAAEDSNGWGGCEGLATSYSTISLESCTSDGVYLPSLAQMVDSATPLGGAPLLSPSHEGSTGALPSLAGGSRNSSTASGDAALQLLQSGAAAEPPAPLQEPWAASEGASGAARPAPAAGDAAAEAQQEQQQEHVPSAPADAALLGGSPPRSFTRPQGGERAAAAGAPAALARRSPIAPPPLPQRRIKLESFDKMLSKPSAAVTEVRLTATPASQASRGGSWLSPAKPRPLPGTAPPPPARRLQRSNSDGVVAALVAAAGGAAPAAGVGASGTREAPAVRRHVTFDASAGPPPASPVRLVRHHTAPAADLADHADALSPSARQQPSHLASGGSRRLTVLGSGLAPPSAPCGDARSDFHALAGLNLEGAQEQEASARLALVSAATAGPPHGTSFASRLLGRGLSLPSLGLARLRSLGRSPGSGSHPHLPSAAAPAAPAAAPAPAPIGAAPDAAQGRGGAAPLDMASVVYGAGAVRAGLDSLGIPPSLAPYWLPGADPLAAMLADRGWLAEQLERTAAALATPATAVEQRAAAEQLGPLLRPGWVVSVRGAA